MVRKTRTGSTVSLGNKNNAPSSKDTNIAKNSTNNGNLNDAIPSTSSTNIEEKTDNHSNYIKTMKAFVPEKIVIVLDTSTDEEFHTFKDNEGNQCIALEILKEAVEDFVELKSYLNKNHEFALVILLENEAKLVCNLTNNCEDFIKSLESVTGCKPEDIFDMNLMFEEIFKITNELQLDNPEIVTSVVRTILIYNRSFTIPKFNLNERMLKLLNSPYFGLDILVSHEPIDDGNKCEEIFKELQSLDTKGSAYFFTVKKDFKTLKTAFAKLLGHLLQRPLQKNWSI